MLYFFLSIQLLLTCLSFSLYGMEKHRDLASSTEIAITKIAAFLEEEQITPPTERETQTTLETITKVSEITKRRLSQEQKSAITIVKDFLLSFQEKSLPEIQELQKEKRSVQAVKALEELYLSQINGTPSEQARANLRRVLAQA